MTLVKPLHFWFFVAVSALFAAACSSSKSMLSFQDMEPASITADSLDSLIPDYQKNLHSLSGNGRAIVSQPGNSDRVTIEFYSDREQSLLIFRAGIGVEGGQILVDRDSMLIYNRVDNYAEKMSTSQSSGSSVGSIASVNIVELFNYTFNKSSIANIYEDERYYAIEFNNSATALISKKEGLVLEVDQTGADEILGYSKIIYEGYAQIDGFYLPRKITIFSNDGRSRATFLVQKLDVNSILPPLEIDMPADIPIYRHL